MRLQLSLQRVETGLGQVGFQEKRAAFAFAKTHPALSLALSVGSAALLTSGALFLVRRFAPEAGGSGVQEIEGGLEGLRALRWQRVLPVKFVGGLLALGGGLVLGREGPIIQMGGNLGKMIADCRDLPPPVERTLVAAGAGAGLAAAFNAPLSGILLVIEEMRP